MNNNKKVLACASFGGHWIQLGRIVEGLKDDYQFVYVCSSKNGKELLHGEKMYVMKNFNRNNWWWGFWNVLIAVYVIIKEHPKAVPTTGAAPGMVCLAVGKLFGVKGIWVDSIANASCLSGSGRIARKCADCIYTQWPDLADEKVKYAGSVLD